MTELIKTTCVGDSAEIVYHVPKGQLLANSEAPFELDTSGYYYSEVEDTGEIVADSFYDFSGATLEVEGLSVVTHPVVFGTEYEAYLLLAYEDGRIIEAELEYECSEVVPDAAPVEILPVTGLDLGVTLALLLVAIGVILVRLTTWGRS